MKKCLLSLMVVLGMGTSLNAQVCDPDTSNHHMGAFGYPTLEWSGVWVNNQMPSFACDSTNPLMQLVATVGQPFDVTLTAALGDTFPSGGLLIPTVSSTYLYNTGLPSWMTIEIKDSVTLSGSRTCIRLTGTPTINDTITYDPITGFNGWFWTSWFRTEGTYFGFPAIDTFGFCHLVRVEQDFTGLNERSAGSMDVAPNPANDFVTLNFSEGVTPRAVAEIRLMTPTGQAFQLPVRALDLQTWRLETSMLPAGTFWIEVPHGDAILREKLIIQR